MPHNNRRVIRNPVAQAAILRKGGVHDKSTKAKRQNNKQALKRQLREGRADRPFFMPERMVPLKPRQAIDA